MLQTYRQLKKKFAVKVTEILTNPRPHLNPPDSSSIDALQELAREADVILMSGTARVSHVVKILTTSTWSHVVMYVGDRRDLLTQEEATRWQEKFGADSLHHLVIDADPIHKVHLRPLRAYEGNILRLCRPEALTPEDREKVIAHALAELGRQYDIGHILRLLLFFALPWEIFPERFRKYITDFALSTDDRICSRILAEAFHSVGYPIRGLRMIQGPQGPVSRKALGIALGLRDRSRSALKLLFGGRIKAARERFNAQHYTEIHLKGTRHITPADYDLSRFFSIIKTPADLNLDYHLVRIVCPMPGAEYDDE